MSFGGGTFSVLAFSPKVTIEHGRLIARANLMLRLAALGAMDRRVVVDPKSNYIMIERRSWWFARRSRSIRFDQIRNIDYAYDDAPTGVTPFGTTTDQIEWFTVSLILADTHERVKLFRFVGEGSVISPGGVLLGDDMIDHSGNQEATSREFVELLLEFTGKRLN